VLKPFFKNNKWFGLILVVIGLLYPFLVYFGLNNFQPGAVVVLVLIFAGLRIAFSAPGDHFFRQGLRGIAIFAAIVVLAGFLVESEIAVRVYPVAISLGFATVFSYTLFRPPTMIERFAKLKEAVITDAIRRYTHRVTCVWIVFFLCNGSASAWTALWGSREQWMLYNGIISYCLIGSLFGIEFLIRQRVQARAQPQG